MESLVGGRNAAKHTLKQAAGRAGVKGRGNRGHAKRTAEKGIALVTALIITLVAFMLVASTLYMIMQSTTMSGAGRAYASAEEAGDGAVQIAKEYITLVNMNDMLPSIFESTVCRDRDYNVVLAYNLDFAITNSSTNTPCTVRLSLPAAAGAAYVADVTITRLFTVRPPGNRIVFAESASSPSKPAVFYRVETRVEDTSTHSVAENAALYRYVPR